jgi:sulfite dehydrogenase
MAQRHKITRRDLFHAGAAASLIGWSCEREQDVAKIPESDLYSGRDLRPLAVFPEKDPLILLTDRPPQLETPLRYFREDLTPNEAHFVRWHLSDIPTSVDLNTWRLAITGNVKTRASLTLDDLKHKFEPVSIVAVNQCSGNARSLFEPRIPGGQWRFGAMSNARWTGVRLKDLLERSGLRAGSVQVSLQGLDKPSLPETPGFEKSLPLDIARMPDVLVAYEINGKPLPMLNGFPARLIVPGWYATYWVKSLSQIAVRNAPLHSFWMDKAYRIPNNANASEQPGKLDANTIPINKIAVHSIFIRPEPGETVPAGEQVQLEGLAMDSGQGIQKVEISTDGGRNWSAAELLPELGKYSWRRWRAKWTPPRKGKYRMMVRATNRASETQPTEQWNHSGYQRAVVEHMDVISV